MPGGAVDQAVTPASHFPVVVLDVPFKKEMQNPQDDFSQDDDCLHFQRVGVVSWALVLIWIRVGAKHTC